MKSKRAKWGFNGQFCIAKISSRACLLWVLSGVLSEGRMSLPLVADKFHGSKFVGQAAPVCLGGWRPDLRVGFLMITGRISLKYTSRDEHAESAARRVACAATSVGITLSSLPN